MVNFTPDTISSQPSGTTSASCDLSDIDYLRSKFRFRDALDALAAAARTVEPASEVWQTIIRSEIEILLDIGELDLAIGKYHLIRKAFPLEEKDDNLRIYFLLRRFGRHGEATAVLQSLTSSGSSGLRNWPQLVIALILEERWHDAASIFLEKHKLFSPSERSLAADLFRTHALIEKFRAEHTIDSPEFLNFIASLGAIRGYRHNFKFGHETTLFDYTAKLENSPLTEHDFNFVELDLILEAVGNPVGKRVLDVGAADGYFSIEFAQRGAQASYLEPFLMMHLRSSLLFEYFGVERQVKKFPRRYDRSFGLINGRFDIVLALGVVYHFNDLLYHLNALAELSDCIVIETATANVTWTDDRQAMHFRENDPLDAKWMVRHMEAKGYSGRSIASWSEYCDRFDKSAGRRMYLFERTP